MRKVLAAIAVVAAVAVGFAWGFLADRNHVFPYRTAEAVARALGLSPTPPAAVPRRREFKPGQVAALRALPYVSGTRDSDPQGNGVTTHVPQRVSPGANLYSPIEQGKAYLVDMYGRDLHEWSYGREPWQHTELLPDGSLLATVKDQRLLALDRRSRLRWEYRARFHHSLSLDGQGRIYALTRRDVRIPEIHPEIDCVDDQVVVLSPEGELLRQFSLLEAVRQSSLAFLLLEVAHRPLDPKRGALDLLHTNHVAVFDGSLAHRSPLFARGNFLVSFRTLSTIAILDRTTLEVLWAWGPNNVVHQHHPSLLDDGHLLVFDNGPGERKRSAVVELDPLTGPGGRVEWSYTADDFYTASRGAAQRLPNGNTLITESDTGYAFEVTPEGERVWVFASPHFTDDGRRMAIWWMTRYPEDELEFLGRR